MPNNRTSTFQCKISSFAKFEPVLAKISFIVAQCNYENEDKNCDADVTLDYIRKKIEDEFPNIDLYDDDGECLELFDQNDQLLLQIFEIEYSKDHFFKDIDVGSLFDKE